MAVSKFRQKKKLTFLSTAATIALKFSVNHDINPIVTLVQEAQTP